MAWQDDMVTVLRALLSDMGTAQVYTDDTLTTVLTVAAYQVLAEGMTFSRTFAVSIANESIIPDPTLVASQDVNFVNLTTLKAASITDRGNAVVAASRAISVRDGGSSVNLEGVFRAKFALLQKGGWTAAYEDAKLEYQAGITRCAGAAVMTAFRKWRYGENFGAQEGYLGGFWGGEEMNREFLW